MAVLLFLHDGEKPTNAFFLHDGEKLTKVACVVKY